MEEVKRKKKGVYFFAAFLAFFVLWVFLVAPFTANSGVAIAARKLMFKHVGISILWFYYTLRPLELSDDEVDSKNK